MNGYIDLNPGPLSETQHHQNNGNCVNHGDLKWKESAPWAMVDVDAGHPCNRRDDAHPGRPGKGETNTRLPFISSACDQLVLSVAREMESPGLSALDLTPRFRSDPACMTDADTFLDMIRAAMGGLNGWPAKAMAGTDTTGSQSGRSPGEPGQSGSSSDPFAWLVGPQGHAHQLAR